MIAVRVGLGLLSLTLAAALSAACRDSDRKAPEEGAGTLLEQTLEPGRARSNRFDPAGVAVGDTVLGLRILTMEVQPSLVDTAGWVGYVRFGGQRTLSGTYRPHPGYPEPEELCFFPDEPSARTLPAFSNDERISWLCFTNQEQVWEELGRPPAAGAATVTVDQYQYSYSHTDVYNTARLLSVVR